MEKNFTEANYALFQISIASANSLFRESGHDALGIYRLLYNAVSHDYFLSQPIATSQDPSGQMLISAPTFEVGIVIAKLREGLNNFTPDIEWSDARIKQYHSDHQAIAELNGKIEKFGFWSFLCFWNKDLNSLRKERNEYFSMATTVEGLIQIAYYKFLEEKQGNLTDFVDGMDEFLSSLQTNKD